MAGSGDNNGLENESAEETDETSPKAALSTSFTISFEDEDEDQSVFKQKKIMKTANMFVRRHVRTLSLPIGNTCLRKSTDDKSRCNGYEVDSSLTKGNEDQDVDRKKDVKPSKKYSSKPKPSDKLESTESEDCLKQNGNCKEEPVSDSDSEGGTYTLDKGNEEVLVARKTIDQVFGISPAEDSGPSNAGTVRDEKKSRSRMVDEWIAQSASAMKTASNSSEVTTVVSKPSLKSKFATYKSKIPSPVFGRREFNPTGSNSNISSTSTANGTRTLSRQSSSIEPGTLKQIVNSPTNGDIDTACYLKETESIVVALHNRLQSDLKQCDVPTKEPPTDKYSNTRFNRAFSLRRDRLKNPTMPPTTSVSSVPVRKNSFGKYVTQSSRVTKTNGYTPPCAERRVNPTRLVKPLSAPISRTKEQTKTDDSKKNVYQRTKTSGGFRSNSSLSTQEIEFQNWKRRKSYDPLKAAAEDRKKKSMMQPVAGCSASVSTAALTNKQKSADQNESDTRSETSEKGITRSASFHGLRNKNGYERSMVSEANNINRSASSRFIPNDGSNSSEDLNNLYEDDWIVPKPPSTSLQNTPPESVSSRLSLLSHAMSSSSVILSSSSSNTKVNFMTLLNVTELTREIRSAVSCMTNSLRSGVEDSSTKQNGHSLESRSEFSENIDADEENSFYQNNDYDFDGDDTPDTGDDDSKSNDLSGNYHLNIALNNLKQIQDAVQKLQLFCPSK